MSDPLSGRDLHIDRSSIHLEELIGDGQFGCVYRGSYAQTRQDGLRMAVAVKVCRMGEDTSTDLANANKYLLDEACESFLHIPHPNYKQRGIVFGESCGWVGRE